MPRCPHCHQTYETPRGEHDAASATAETTEASARWTPVARMTNLAEVGFFCDRLADAGIAARVHDQEQFDAISGLWQPSFVVAVAEEDRARAIDVMRQSFEPGEEVPSARHGMPGAAARQAAADRWLEDLVENPRHRDGGSLWVPMAMALVAGGIAAWMTRDVLQQPTEQRPAVEHAFDLGAALAESDDPLMTPLPAGGRLRRLTFDRRGERFVLDEDTTGDGAFDVRRYFDRSGRMVESRQ